MRFVPIENNSDFPNNGETCWYWDTNRPVKEEDRDNTDWPYIVVQCYCGKDPNTFVKIENLDLLYVDQAEYYAVCPNCRSAYSAMQWSGSTRSPGWREQSERYLKRHQQTKGWCEFCDPIFGNGGWS